MEQPALIETGKAKEKPKRLDQQWFDMVCETAQIDPKAVTQSQRGALNDCIHQLCEIGATIEEFRKRWDTYSQQWPTWPRTPHAVVKHWAELERPPTEAELQRELENVFRRWWIKGDESKALGDMQGHHAQFVWLHLFGKRDVPAELKDVARRYYIQWANVLGYPGKDKTYPEIERAIEALTLTVRQHKR